MLEVSFAAGVALMGGHVEWLVLRLEEIGFIKVEIKGLGGVIMGINDGVKYKAACILMR